MNSWESFEYIHQLLLAPLLWKTDQKQVFRQTNQCHERLLIDLVGRVIQPTHFFEIGAYEAAASITIASRLPSTHCIAFEGDPDVHAHFSKKHAAISNFSYVHSAVSDKDGTISFNKQVKGKDESFSLLAPNNSIREKSLGIEYQSVTVPTIKIDTYAHGLTGLKNSVLRIDVEGMCYEVLKGSQNTLRTCSAIYAEVEDYEIWKDQKTVFDIYPLLDNQGFVPVSRDVQSPGQYNVLWLRKELAIQRQFRARLALYHSELAKLTKLVS